jgi:predicted transcriptional regulator
MAAKKAPYGKPGRKPSGKGGTSVVQTYPAFTVRLPPDVKYRLQAGAMIRRLSQARLIEEALEAWLKQLPRDERKRIDDVVAGWVGSDA